MAQSNIEICSYTRSVIHCAQLNKKSVRNCFWPKHSKKYNTWLYFDFFGSLCEVIGLFLFKNHCNCRKCMYVCTVEKSDYKWWLFKLVNVYIVKLFLYWLWMNHKFCWKWICYVCVVLFACWRCLNAVVVKCW